MLIPLPAAIIAPRVAPVTVTGAPGASEDDANEAIATTVVSINGNALTWNQANLLGLRFPLSGSIPQGKTILTAIPSVVPSGTSSTVWTGRIRAQASGNGAAFQAVNADLSGRALTTASVDLVDPAFVQDVRFNLPEIKTVIQEVVDGAELTNLVLILTEVSGDSRNIRAFDFSGGSSPANITITYMP